MRNLTNLTILALIMASPVLAQNEMGNQSPKIYLNAAKTRYIGFGAYLQFWARYLETNPGTFSSAEANAEEVEELMDFSLRRMRFNFKGMLSEKTYFLFNMGFNNLNMGTSRPIYLRILDAYFEHRPKPYFHFGAGKAPWTGPSRYAAPSSSKQLGADIALHALSTVNRTDDLLRKMSVFVKGDISKLNYRLVLSRPFSIQTTSSFKDEPRLNRSDYADISSQLQHSAYFKWQFWDKESRNSAYHVGTYLGKKKVLTLGFGYEYQPKTFWHYNADSIIKYEPLQHWVTDLFMDLPLNKAKNTALTLYLAQYNYDMGKNYLLVTNGNGPGTEFISKNSNSMSGDGNKFPIIGTGVTWYGQLAYLLPKDFLVDQGQFSVYGTSFFGDFDYLEESSKVYEGGVNYFRAGHLAKWTLGFQSRPVFDKTTRKEFDRKLYVVLQAQFRLE